MDTDKRSAEVKKCLAVVGSTASGKSALALALAKAFDGEIVSVDSMQVYRGMDIGTAKPTARERADVVHHMIDVCAPETPFSAADYAAGALDAIRGIAVRGRLPILCGGTGLYLDALMRGEAPEATAADETVRAKLRDFLNAHGAHALHERLREIDPESADMIHENNVRRVMRAIEVYTVSGKPKSAWDAESRERPLACEPFVLGLVYHDRSRLYARINVRVDAMLADGLLAETERLEKAGVFACNGTAAAAIGYKELLPALHGECTLAEATERLKTATRRYAKRQMTWFSAKPYVQPLYCDGEDGELRAPEDLFAEASARIRAYLDA